MNAPEASNTTLHYVRRTRRIAFGQHLRSDLMWPRSTFGHQHAVAYSTSDKTRKILPPMAPGHNNHEGFRINYAISMHINDDHMYHGAALTQIADRPEFKAINTFSQLKARGAFRINDDIGIYVKHAGAPNNSTHSEYLFQFTQKSQGEVKTMRTLCKKVYIVFVCVEDKEICVISGDQLDTLIELRQDAYRLAYGKDEIASTILVTADAGKQFRVYANQPKKKGATLGRILVPRSDFPSVLFSN